MADQKEKDERSGTVWVLETQTKGTGANMVPLEKVLRKPGSDAVPGFAFRRLQPSDPEPPPSEPRRFKVVDLMTQEVLAEDVDARRAVDALEDLHTIVDAIVYVWEPDRERWRLLTFPETSALWDFRDQGGGR